MFSEKEIFFSQYKSVGVNDPWDMANLDPRDIATY